MFVKLYDWFFKERYDADVLLAPWLSNSTLYGENIGSEEVNIWDENGLEPDSCSESCATFTLVEFSVDEMMKIKLEHLHV